jgi:methyl-accepting chemotaxis protein
MMELFKDRYKLGLVMATLFFAGIVVSLYQVYRLPYKLMLPQSNHPALVTVYFVLGITFLIGAFTIWSSLNYKNEVIVFREKQRETGMEDKENSTTGESSISLDHIMENLKQAKNEAEIIQSGLHAVCDQLKAGQGALYLVQEDNGHKKVELKSGFALNMAENAHVVYELGEGLIGQAAATGKVLYIDDVPEGYVKILSGLGSASPRFLLIVSLIQQNNILGVMEIASFTPLDEQQRKFAEESARLIAENLSNR